ncbi:hypothetical protein SEVIR_4G064002v4 [Setaria viridis]|uniref:Uncharacterized protein n=1 Tax=Setaria viridis TaxID=4556 RepID=A0A4U6UWC9_SETVI|nr:hypothetical protein SEVIR_4G064002v2 [Setaria viridis]
MAALFLLFVPTAGYLVGAAPTTWTGRRHPAGAPVTRGRRGSARAAYCHPGPRPGGGAARRRRGAVAWAGAAPRRRGRRRGARSR